MRPGVTLSPSGLSFAVFVALLMRHADIRTTMNVYGKAMDASKRKAHGKVVRMVLAPKVA